jgi:ABC-2 type transport system permease protein
MKLAHDTWLIFQRQWLLTWRTPVAVAFGIAQPITYLVLFAPILKLALSADGVTNYAQAFRIYVPGLLTVMAVIGGMAGGYGLLADIRSGVIERVRVTPMHRLSLVLGRVLRDMTKVLADAALITVLALPFGLRVGLGELGLAFVLLAVLSLMSASFGYALALWVRTEGTLGRVILTLANPIMLLAGVLLPLTLAPLWMVRIAKWNPFYWATNGMRALYAGQAGAFSVWVSLVILVGLVMVVMPWSARMFARASVR